MPRAGGRATQQLDRPGGHAEIVKFSDDPAFPCSVVDMTPVYEGQAESARRGMALLPSGEVLVRDELTGLEAGHPRPLGHGHPGRARRDRRGGD